MDHRTNMNHQPRSTTIIHTCAKRRKHAIGIKQTHTHCNLRAPKHSHFPGPTKKGGDVEIGERAAREDLNPSRDKEGLSDAVHAQESIDFRKLEEEMREGMGEERRHK